MSRWRTSWLSTLPVLVVGIAVACGCTAASPPETSTPTPAPATAVPTAPATPPPSPTLPPPTASPTPTVAPETEGSTERVVVARAEGSGAFAIASLSGITLEAGHEYVLQVTSAAGQARFFGSYSASALGGSGDPGVQVELLNGTTPAEYPITPPVADPRNWIYAVSVQNRGSGGIILTILDVTGSPDRGGGSLLPPRGSAYRWGPGGREPCSGWAYRS
jgi:hypothetical protein